MFLRGFTMVLDDHELAEQAFRVALCRACGPELAVGGSWGAPDLSWEREPIHIFAVRFAEYLAKVDPDAEGHVGRPFLREIPPRNGWVYYHYDGTRVELRSEYLSVEAPTVGLADRINEICREVCQDDQ